MSRGTHKLTVELPERTAKLYAAMAVACGISLTEMVGQWLEGLAVKHEDEINTIIALGRMKRWYKDDTEA